MTTTKTPQIALLKLSLRKTKDLIMDLVMTGKIIDTHKKAVDPNMFTVRGWILDEIERRDQEAFDRWLDSDTDDVGLLEYFHC